MSDGFGWDDGFYFSYAVCDIDGNQAEEGWIHLGDGDDYPHICPECLHRIHETEAGRTQPWKQPM